LFYARSVNSLISAVEDALQVKKNIFRGVSFVAVFRCGNTMGKIPTGPSVIGNNISLFVYIRHDRSTNSERTADVSCTHRWQKGFHGSHCYNNILGTLKHYDDHCLYTEDDGFHDVYLLQSPAGYSGHA